MAARPKQLIAAAAVAVACAAALGWGAFPAAGVSQAERTAARRVVSLVPALTEMLFAIGAGPQVVGVSSFDTYPPEIGRLPRVGALLDPDTERILSLRPTLVLIYGSQETLAAQLTRAGIQTYVYRHGGIDTIYRTMRELGDATGQRVQADRVVSGLRAQADRVRARVRGRPRPRTLLVIGRQPGTLRELYASGGRGFLHEMLEAAGGTNVFGDVLRESVQPSHETLITRAPDVIVELHAEGMLDTGGADERAAWSVLPSLPAVRRGRVHGLIGQYLVVPGPRFAQGIDTIARALHPDAFR